MIKFTKTLLTATAISSTLILTACTNELTTAGNVSSYFNGTITDMEAIDINTENYDKNTNMLLGAAAGALLGNLINGKSTGTLVGAAVGGLAGHGLSKVGNRKDGVRLSIDSDNGPLVVDMPFSCKYAIGKKVRLVSGSSRGAVMVKINGHWQTATQDAYSKCPALYNQIKD